jgi:hypothetical protein
MLISNKEHANKIDDEIIAEIRRSAFLVADFTGHRQNVYFETGFAIGLARQVVWTCRKDEIKDLHLISGSTIASTGRTRRSWRADFNIGSRLCLAEGRSPLSQTA